MKNISSLKKDPYRAFLFLCTVTLVCLSFGSFVAANDNSDRQFSRKVGKKTMKALELINSQKYKPASVKLELLLKNPDLSAYERSTISQMSGQAYYSLGQTQLAILAFEIAVDAGGLLPAEANRMRKTIAQLYIAEQEYERGAEMLEQWGRDGNKLKLADEERLIEAWVLSERFERALPWAERWFDASNPKERKHYDLLNYLYNQLGETEKQTSTLKAMAERWPNDQVIQRALESPDEATRTPSTAMIPSFRVTKTENRGNFKITESDRDAQPIVRIPPDVPKGTTTSGHCKVRFNVTKEGNPVDVQTTFCTHKSFEQVTIETIHKWKYNPKIRDGKAMSRTGVETQVKFFVAGISE